MTGKIVTSVSFLAALAVLAGGINPVLAREDAPCVELRLKGGYEVAIPCPEGLDEVLSLFQPRQRRGDIVIDPQWPHDQAMANDHDDWPYDGPLIVPQTDEAVDALPPTLDDSLEDFLSWFGQEFNDLASMPEQDSLDTWEPKLQIWRHIKEAK